MDKFIKFIDKTGQQKLADKLGVTKTAVWYWRCGRFRPSTKYAKKLVKLSDKFLTLEDILGD